MRCCRLRACHALARYGARGEEKGWKRHKEIRHEVRGESTNLGRWKVGTTQACFKLPVSAGSWQESRPLIRLRVSRLWTEIGQWPWFDPLPSRAFTPGIPEREAAFTVMYCTAHCAGAREGGRSGLRQRGSLCGAEERAKEREREKS